MKLLEVEREGHVAQCPMVPQDWLSGVVVSALASINEVNQRLAGLVLRRVTVSGFNSRCLAFISVSNQPATQG